MIHETTPAQMRHCRPGGVVKRGRGVICGGGASIQGARHTLGDGRGGDARADDGVVDHGARAVGAVRGGAERDGAGDPLAGAGGAPGDRAVPRPGRRWALRAGGGVLALRGDAADRGELGGAGGAVHLDHHRVCVCAADPAAAAVSGVFFSVNPGAAHPTETPARAPGRPLELLRAVPTPCGASAAAGKRGCRPTARRRRGPTGVPALRRPACPTLGRGCRAWLPTTAGGGGPCLPGFRARRSGPGGAPGSRRGSRRRRPGSLGTQSFPSPRPCTGSRRGPGAWGIRCSRPPSLCSVGTRSCTWRTAGV